MENHNVNNRTRPTSLALKKTTADNSYKMEERRGSVKSPDTNQKSPSKRLLRQGPPPGFGSGVIPSIQISPASPRSPGSKMKEILSPSLDPHDVIRRRISALMDGFAKAKKLELSVIALVEATFPGEKLQLFLDNLSRQILCETPFLSGQRVAAMMVRALILRGSILEATVVDTISNGVIKDLGNLLVLPQGTGELAGFLTDLFLMEPDLKWLLTLTDNVPRHSAICTELIHGVIESLKLRMPMTEVQSRIKKTLQNGWVE